MNNKVKFLRGTATEYEASTKDNDTFYYTTDDEKLYLGDKEITGGGVTIDDALSDTSEHPVQNKIINAALNSKAELSDIPTSLPASGGNADTVDDKHASDFIYARGYLNGIDLDDIKYPCSALAISCVHRPSDQWGTLLVYAGGTGSFTQIYIPTADDGTPTTMYFRHHGNTGWTSWRNTADGGNANTLDGKHASDFALKTDIPTTLPANGGTANAARETVSPNAKAKLWEDSEGGNLRLVSPDGHNYVEMDIFNNESFRMYFAHESDIIQALTYNFTQKKLDINGNAATVNGLTVQTAVPANAKFTDTKVTAVGNHYTPSGGTTTSASGGSLTDITNSSSGVQVVTGVTKDAAGHVTGVTSVALKSTNTNTTYGAASTSANGLMTTGAQTFAGNKTFNGQIIPAGASAVGTAQARKIYAGTSDMTAGTTKLETGAIYLVYE